VRTTGPTGDAAVRRVILTPSGAKNDGDGGAFRRLVTVGDNNEGEQTAAMDVYPGNASRAADAAPRHLLPLISLLQPTHRVFSHAFVATGAGNDHTATGIITLADATLSDDVIVLLAHLRATEYDGTGAVVGSIATLQPIVEVPVAGLDASCDRLILVTAPFDLSLTSFPLTFPSMTFTIPATALLPDGLGLTDWLCALAGVAGLPYPSLMAESVLISGLLATTSGLQLLAVV
jgi:hypothetical protein